MKSLRISCQLFLYHTREKGYPSTGLHVTGGSPPRVRGKERGLPVEHRKEGITPARAGKRNWPPEQCGPSRDHPRACGEKGKAAKKKFASSGSPPRVRGKALSQPGVIAAWGITPARAGKRYGSSCESSTHRDHPRACGEKIREQLRKLNAQGSPPRMRGKV